MPPVSLLRPWELGIGVAAVPGPVRDTVVGWAWSRDKKERLFTAAAVSS